MFDDNPKTITVEEAIIQAKIFRKEADGLLQKMKAHTKRLKDMPSPLGDSSLDKGEVLANHILSVRHVEDAIMRQGMTMKNFGTADPYPSSKDPSTTHVEPTADGLKL